MANVEIENTVSTAGLIVSKAGYSFDPDDEYWLLGVCRI